MMQKFPAIKNYFIDVNYHHYNAALFNRFPCLFIDRTQTICGIVYFLKLNKKYPTFFDNSSKFIKSLSDINVFTGVLW